MTEREQFDNAMKRILCADPKIVKKQLEAEMLERAEARKAKRASSDRVSSESD